MRTIFSFLLVISTLYSFAQHRVTDYQNIAFTGKTIVQEVDGINYVMFVSANNDVRINKLEDIGALRHLRTINVPGINSSLSAVHEQFLVTVANGFKISNFTTGNRGGIYASLNDGVVNTNEFMQMNGGEVLFRGSYLPSTGTRYFYMSSNFRYEHIPEGLKAVYLRNGKIFCSQFKDNKYEYSLFLPVTETLLTLFGNTEKNHGPFIDEQNVWYINENFQLVRFSVDTKKQKIYPVTSSYEESDNSVIIHNDEALILQSNGDSLFIESFNINNFQKTKELKLAFSGKPNVRYSRMLGNQHLLLKSDAGSIASIDLSDGTLIQFQCNEDYVFFDWPILDSKYVLLPFDKQLRVCNLLDGSFFTSQEYASKLSFWSPSVIHHDGQYFVSAFHNLSDVPNLFQISTETFSIKTSSFFDTNNSGMPVQSKLFKTDLGHHASGDNVYFLKDKSGVEVVGPESSGTDIPFQLIADNLYQTFADDSFSYLTIIEGQEKSILAKFKKTIPPLHYWTVTSNYFYYADRTKFWKRIPLSGGDPVSFPHLNNQQYHNYIAHRDNFFFFKDNVIICTNDHGTEKSFFTNADPTKWQFTIIGEKLFLQTPKIIYLWQNDVFVPMFDKLSTNYNIHINEEFNHFLIWNPEEKSGFLWKEDQFLSIAQLPFSLIQIRPNQFLKHKILFSDGYSQHYIYEVTTNSWISIPDIETGIHIDGLLFMPKDTFLIGHDAAYLYTYQLSNNFTKTSLKYTLPYEEYIESSNITTLSDFALFQTNLHLFYINSSGRLIKIEELLSSPETQYQSLGKEEKSVYFFALEKSSGRQVYVLDKQDKWEDAIPEPPVIQWVLYPNPTLNSIGIRGLLKLPYQYHITDDSGRLVESAKSLSSSIDVSSFPAGLYFIKIIQSGQKKVFPFVKI